MPRGSSDAAISDIAGTLLMVGAVVLAGGALTAVVSANLSQPGIPAVSLALAPIAAGDASLSVILKNGADLPLAELAISLQRDDASGEPIPRGSWTTADPEAWGSGERLTFALTPPAGASERFLVRVALANANAQLAALSARTGTAGAAFGAATLVSNMTPGTLVADGVSAARLTVQVSHPAGAGAIARVVADLVNLSNASRTANATLDLHDTGQDGDEIGGDGNWSALLRAPAVTSPGTYNITINATDLSGALAGTTLTRIAITGNVSFLVGGSGSGGSGGGGAGGSVTGGACYGCVVTGGVSSYEGTRLGAPTSENVSSFRLRNWTWDKLTPAKMRDDALVIRIVNDSAAWSMYFRFDYLANTPCMTYARAWNALNETVYAPRNGTCLPLAGLDLNLMDPVAEEQLVVTSGSNPNSLYRSARMQGHTTFILAYLRDEDPTGQDEISQEIGVFSMDVVMT